VRIPGFNARALGRGWGDDIQARLQNGIGKHRFKTAGFWVSERANKKLGEGEKSRIGCGAANPERRLAIITSWHKRCNYLQPSSESGAVM
jgi:hypothetical protein